VAEGADETVLELIERPDAHRPERTAGLYHLALLYPSRLELARAAARIATGGVRIEGASDHGTHEAIYLPDPDGNGLELAWDRPRSSWPDPLYDMSRIEDLRPRPLDLRGLLELVSVPAGVPARAEAGLGVGHVHLHVGDTTEASHFYGQLLGYTELFRIPEMAFFAAGDYHHHVGTNTWRGRGVPPVPVDVVGLGWWTARLPQQHDLDELRARLDAAGVQHVDLDGGGLETHDPWNMAVRFEVDTPGGGA
jgi:catechol 2,3-dioxygenase